MNCLQRQNIGTEPAINQRLIDLNLRCDQGFIDFKKLKKNICDYPPMNLKSNRSYYADQRS